jgi:hypothetical protein
MLRFKHAHTISSSNTFKGSIKKTPISHTTADCPLRIVRREGELEAGVTKIEVSVSEFEKRLDDFQGLLTQNVQYDLGDLWTRLAPSSVVAQWLDKNRPEPKIPFSQASRLTARKSAAGPNQSQLGLNSDLVSLSGQVAPSWKSLISAHLFIVHQLMLVISLLQLLPLVRGLEIMYRRVPVIRGAMLEIYTPYHT